MSRRMVLIAVAGLAIIVAVAGIVGAQTGAIEIGPADPATSPSSTVEGSTNDVVSSTTSPDDAASYWTEERMRDATPAPMPNPTITDGEAEQDASGSSGGGAVGGHSPGGAVGSGDGGESETPDAGGYEPAPMPNPTVDE